MTIGYDGSLYQGWQKQVTTEATIQGILETTISGCIGYPVTIDGSGRTDAGVHAACQIANVKFSGKIDEEKFRDELNEKLPIGIRIYQIELVKNGFHSRYQAVGKRYEYTVDTREKPDVFRRKYVYHDPRIFSIEAMREAASYLIGTHDFTSMTDKDKKDEKSAVRTIYQIDIREEKEKIIFSYDGTGFLYHMVRILTGTLLEVGCLDRKPEEIKEILAAKDRKKAGFLAPASGLCLKEVYYEK